VEGIRRFQDLSIVEGVIAADGEPAARANFGGEIHAPGAGEVGVEESAGAERASRGDVGNEGETDDVAIAVVEIGGGEAEFVAGKELIEADIDGATAFGLEGVVAGEAGIAAEGFVEGRFFQALAEREAETSVTPDAGSITKCVDRSSTRNYAGTEGGVCLGADASANREPGKGEPTGVEKAGLIVAASVTAAKAAGETVFDFILVAGGGGAGAKGVGGLLAEPGAIELIGGGEKRRVCIGVESAIFVAADGVLPVRAGAEIPGEVNEKELKALVLRERGGLEKRGAGNS